jgi:hypothetical protein
MTWKGKGRWILLVIVLVAVGAWLVPRDTQRTEGGGPSGREHADVARIIPESIRIRVEVLNATTTRGLARRATFHLRDLGFDVVGSGNSAERRDSSVVIAHTGRMEWARLAAEALGGARIEERPDSSRYLDLTILLGARWRPPPEAFHP